MLRTLIVPQKCECESYFKHYFSNVYFIEVNNYVVELVYYFSCIRIFFFFHFN